MTTTALAMSHPGPLPTEVPAHKGIRLRTAGGNDEERLAALLTDAFGEHWDVARVRRELLDAADVAAVWVAEDEDGGAQLATASELLRPEFGEAGCVHWVGTAPHARGRGLGRLVTSACLVGFANRGFEQAVLNTDDGRAPAVALYLRLGFQPNPRTSAERQAWSRLLDRPPFTGK